MKNIITSICVLSLNFFPAQFEKVIDFQKKLINHEVTSSNVAMVYKDGNIIFKNIENSMHKNSKPIYNNSIFPIWSMSKPITIVGMMILKERGLINFEDKLSKYIPEFKNLKCKSENGIYKCKNEITLFHLMTHRSGYKYYGNPHNFTSTIRYNNLKDFAYDVANHPVEFEPGSKYLYGINMAILGRVVEVVTKKSFYDFLKQEIFDPLEMYDTKFYLTKEERKRFQPLFINNSSLKGYTEDLDELTYDKDNKAYFGGEGLVSTLDNYSNFCKMLVNDGTFNNKQLISKESLEIMVKSYTKKEGDPFDYGFSLFVLGNPELDGTNSSKGIYGWSGYHNTHFWIDSEKKIFGLFLTRAREFSFEIQKQFRQAVYNSIN